MRDITNWLYILIFTITASPAISFAEQSTEQPTPPQSVKVFTNSWSRLFSGSESSFSMALTYNSGLTKKNISIPTSRDTSEKRYGIDQKLLLSMQYSPLSYFFANITLGAPIQNINKYSTNFSYSFGYDDWHPETFSLVYSNYSDSNRFYPQHGNHRTNFDQGTITAAYKFTLPQSIDKYLLINQNDSLSCQVGYSYSPHYFDSKVSGIKNNKSKLLGSCGYTLKQHYFLRMSAFYSPNNKQRQPWDGDYSYSIGYVSSYEPGAISVQYNNYAATRYPWRSSSSAKARYGTVSLSWTLPW